MKEPKKNYNGLQQNQKQIEQKIKKYISSLPGSVESTPLKLHDIKFDLTSPNYKGLIEQLEENRDALQGIKWVKQFLTDGSIVLIRDARNTGKDVPPLDSAESYKIQFLNAARAAEELLDIELNDHSKHKLNGLKNTVRLAVIEFLDKNYGKDDIKRENAKLVEILKAAGIKDAGKKIAVAKDFGNFSDQPYHVTTITKQQDKDKIDRLIIESDAMLLGLTEKQKYQYLAIKNSERGENVELVFEGKHVDMSWYNNLPSYLKDLVHKNAGKIAEGKYVIPTQLRGELVGIRNAYSKTTYLTPPDDIKGELEMVSRTLHAGTASFHGKQVSKEQQQEITNENLKQLESFVAEGRSTTVNVLNSPANPSGIDSSIDEQVGKGQHQLGGNKATTPFNAWRMISRNDNSGFEKILSNVGTIAFGLGMTEISQYLKEGKNEQAARTQLKRMQEEGYKLQELDALEHAINAKHHIVTSHLFRDPNNSNLTLSTEIGLVNFSLQQGALKEHIKNNEGPVSEIVVQCASGKDRTGLELTDQTFKAVSSNLGIKEEKDLQQNNLEAQVKGGHTQFMASINGGTRGAHGIKKDTLAAFPKDLYKEHIVGLQQNTASYNKFKYDDLEKQSFISKIINKVINILTKPFKSSKDDKFDMQDTTKFRKFTDQDLKNLEVSVDIKKSKEEETKGHGHQNNHIWAEGIINKRQSVTQHEI